MYRGGRGGRGGYNNSYSNNNNYSNQNSNNTNGMGQDAVTLEIFNWNNASTSDLASFISRKTRVSIRNIQVDATTNVLRASVRNDKEAQEVQKLNGSKFAGANLKISIVGLQTSSTMDLLKSFLASRYDSQSKMLNLENMINDPILVSNGLFSTANTSSKMFPALMKLAEIEKLDIESVNLSSTNLGGINFTMSILGTTFPNLKNLALTNNNITKTRYFDQFKGRFNQLRQLYISGNPVLSENPQPHLVKLFPRLLILDGVVVRDEAKVNAILTFPIQSSSMFFESKTIQDTATGFVANFLNLWDTRRADLLQLYTPDSQFSYQIDTTHIADPVSQSSNLQPHSWGYYIPNSRNLTRVSAGRSRMARLAKGPEAISKLFKNLPKTKHHLMDQPDAFAMEAWSFPALQGIMVVLHGEFEEIGAPEQIAHSTGGPKGAHRRPGNYRTEGSLEKRSFDRTFVIVQGPNGSLIVASDLLLIRVYAGSKAWSTQSPTPAPSAPSGVASPVAAAPSNSANVISPEVLNKLTPIQQQMAAAVMNETRLSAQFTLMLCEQSQWNYEAALQSFQASKAQIPPEAFQ
ncbi:unnamed protein product [Kuraishia capsulata CBS 1993]|uniref:NTF2 domain-containing protein n=1 Tax=Kuraishia capsulata CBS 1993 TaxID=1382522 RepID=W6MLR1_9ASCO|nr:uncharacterized protein KUCA_T00003419001 [Kuraishia capsulata CBS 1993]CDK27441.1 unnamed protein product [Kuraishia capsulata CBS 1993]